MFEWKQNGRRLNPDISHLFSYGSSPERMGPASICGGIQWGAIGPPWPGGGSREPFGRFPGAPLVTFPAQGKSRPRRGPRRSRRLHECKIIFLRVQALVLLRNPPLIRRSAPASPRGSQGTGRPCAGAAKGTLKSKRVLPAVWSAAQRRIYHPLVPRRFSVPFASAPCAPGVQGNTPAALFPRFLSR